MIRLDFSARTRRHGRDPRDLLQPRFVPCRRFRGRARMRIRATARRGGHTRLLVVRSPVELTGLLEVD